MLKKAWLTAWMDLVQAIEKIQLALMLGWQDINLRYRRSSFGPFWITISMGVMIGTLGMVFGQIFSAQISEFLPFLSIGMIMWAYFSTTVTEGCTVFTSAEGIIKQLDLPLMMYLIRLMWKNLLFLGHNLLIVPLVYIAMMRPVGWVALLCIPGFVLLMLNTAWISLLTGVICTRYRDLPQIVINVLQVAFYLTPIMWMPQLLPTRASLYLLDINPFYHMIEVVRAPLLNQMPTLCNWGVSFGMAVVGGIVALLFFGRYRDRIAYWL